MKKKRLRDLPKDLQFEMKMHASGRKYEGIYNVNERLSGGGGPWLAHVYGRLLARVERLEKKQDL